MIKKFLPAIVIFLSLPGILSYSLYADDIPEIALGIESGSEDLLNENKKVIYLGPLFKFRYNDLYVKLQWEPYIYPDKENGIIFFSVRKIFHFTDDFLLELINENNFSLIGEDHDGIIITKPGYNINNFLFAIEFPVLYTPERLYFTAFSIEYKLKNTYTEFNIRSKYTYMIEPEKKPDGIEIKFKNKIKIFTNYKIESELTPAYRISKETYELECRLGINYYF